jgi:hypothetical protein
VARGYALDDRGRILSSAELNPALGLDGDQVFGAFVVFRNGHPFTTDGYSLALFHSCEEPEFTTVYQFSDPRTHTLAYVGATTQPLEHRTAQHEKADTPCGDWLRELKALGLRPIVVTRHIANTWRDGLAIEAETIRALRPTLNRQHNQ